MDRCQVVGPSLLLLLVLFAWRKTLRWNGSSFNGQRAILLLLRSPWKGMLFRDTQVLPQPSRFPSAVKEWSLGSSSSSVSSSPFWLMMELITEAPETHSYYVVLCVWTNTPHSGHPFPKKRATNLSAAMGNYEVVPFTYSARSSSLSKGCFWRGTTNQLLLHERRS